MDCSTRIFPMKAFIQPENSCWQDGCSHFPISGRTDEPVFAKINCKPGKSGAIRGNV